MVEADHLVKNGAIELNLQLSKPGFIEISLFDENGELGYNYCTYNQPLTYSHHIPLSQLSGEFYLLRVAYNGDTILNKVVEPGKNL